MCNVFIYFLGKTFAYDFQMQVQSKGCGFKQKLQDLKILVTLISK